MNITELHKQVEYLSDKINLIYETVQFNISTFLAVIGISLVIAGVALVIIAKYLFMEKLEKEASKIDEKIKTTILTNPQLLWARGSCILMYQDYEKREAAYIISGLTSFTEDKLIYIDVYYDDNDSKVSVGCKNINISDNEIKIVLTNKDQLKHYYNIELKFFILWKSSIYKINN